MSLNNRQMDIAGLLAEWREVTDNPEVTAAPWSMEEDWAYIASSPDSVIHGYYEGDCPACGEEIQDNASVALSGENAASRTAMPALLTAVENVLKLHRPYGVYDECDCPDEQKDDGHHIEVDEVGLTCNHLYDVCAECCTNDGYLTEACGYHDHGKDAHLCPTVAAIRDAIGGAA